MTGRQRLTLDTAKTMGHEDLIKAAFALLEPYEQKHDQETEVEREDRLSRTYDQVPDIYAWFNQLWSYFDHWADFFYKQDKTGLEYKGFRQKRDVMEKAASSAKLRYEGASRRMTQLERHEEAANMRQSR